MFTYIQCIFTLYFLYILSFVFVDFFSSFTSIFFQYIHSACVQSHWFIVIVYSPYSVPRSSCIELLIFVCKVIAVHSVFFVFFLVSSLRSVSCGRYFSTDLHFEPDYSIVMRRPLGQRWRQHVEHPDCA